MRKFVFVRCGVLVAPGDFKATEGCGRSTFYPFKRDPRKRWLVNVRLVDVEGNFGEKGKELVVNLCPACAKEQFNLQDSDYDALVRSEMAVMSKVN
jgi:hypothetical protein